MFRWLSYITDFIGGLCVLLSPFAVIHWVLLAANVPSITQSIAPASIIFAPGMAFLSALPFTYPSLTIQGQAISIQQMILGVAYLFLFFVFNLISMGLRNAEGLILRAQRKVNQKHEDERAQQQQMEKYQQAIQRSSVILTINYPFKDFREATRFMLGSQLLPGQSILAQSATQASFQFTSPESAASFAVSGAERLLSFYASLSPIDPQPPFRMVIHATEPRNLDEGIERCRYLLDHCLDNHIIFSQQVHDLMAAHNVQQRFKFHSIGIYHIPSENQQDLYQLNYNRPEQKVYF